MNKRLCCERRPIAASAPCDCGPGFCANCKRCENHCGCPFDLREICYGDVGDELPEPDLVAVVG